MFLTKEELKELTGRERRDAQVRALRFMGIEHRLRPDASVAVLRSHVEEVLSGNANSKTREKRHEPNWDALQKLGE